MWLPEREIWRRWVCHFDETGWCEEEVLPYEFEARRLRAGLWAIRIITYGS